MEQEVAYSTREYIMQMLKIHGELSTKAITESLGITGMAVRRHLESLKNDGYITYRTVKQPMGRPVSLYSLTHHAEDFFPKNYHSLALDLLQELQGEAGDEIVSQLFDKRKETLRKKYMPIVQNEALESRVAALAQIQNDNGYMVDYQKVSENEYVLEELNCPISQVANRYQDACRCELDLFESLLGADVKRTECLASGGKKCVYHIRQST
ncbi:transcriptional regulator [Paenibacillus sp. JCM 10914]|uniref:helix-turn-helix transcriptional regulator n=1 Tax=Paenibacillus sp. JCM 10914 TaxID=1236974 RepID=UPI0003CC57CF|nr:metalloregulator ArsR/SmtB family transcription factor [Paenibacillus sp. JCM 10914]GAE05018.1 transcriptional regulator, DeoR family [Paenibacillus sp. JCM 10914]